MKNRPRMVLVTTAFLLVGSVGASVTAAYELAGRLMWPPSHVHRSPEQGLDPAGGGDPSHELGLRFESVEFATADGSTLRGWYVPSARPSAVSLLTVHGGSGDRRTYMKLVPALHEAGYPVLLFDLRDHGISDGTGRGLGFGAREHEDVIAAARFVRARAGAAKVVALGVSLGASAALLAAASSREIDAVVSEAAAADLYDSLRALPSFAWLPDWMVRLTLWCLRARIDATPAQRVALEGGTEGRIGDIAPRPVLIIHGRDDLTVPVDHARRLYLAAGQPRRLWVVDGAGHGDILANHLDDYGRRVLAFLADNRLSP